MSAPSGGQNPYADTALDYHKAGWLGPLPLPPKRKDPPPEGFNKKVSVYPTVQQINEWRTWPNRNICVRCSDVDDDHEVIGIDVDQYLKGENLKTGFDQLERLIVAYGPLSDTWIATSRTDGKSGIRFFRAPKGLKFHGQAAKDIEILRKGHRYAVVWPSIHPDGRTYWWYPPGVEPTEENKRAWDGEIPDPRKFPLLPGAWIDYLTNNRTLSYAEDELIDEDSSVDEIYQWADETFSGGECADLCKTMRKRLDGHIADIKDSSTYHGYLIDAHWSLTRCAFEGHRGWNEAINEYEAAFVDFIMASRGGTTERTVQTLNAEIFRSRIEALRKTKGESDEQVKNHASPLLREDCKVIGCKDLPKEDKSPIFRVYEPTEWAKTVSPTAFFIKKVLSTDTWGVNGGPKKSLKTHNNQAIGLSVATGKNLYNDARFAVERPGKVLYIVGEGGTKQVFRVLHRMCAAYGVSVKDVQRDPDFPFVVAFGVAPLDSEKLKSELKRMLDTHQPSLVLMESFYNFHPAGVTASNLYERGQVIDSYHKLVRAGGSDVASLLTDHTKKASTGLDLDEISMSGQAENADSWIMHGHRTAPNVQVGDFWLTTSFSSRDWGGNTYDVDWHLGPFDHGNGGHTGHISWDVHDHGAIPATGAQAFSMLRSDILALVNANPWRENRSSLTTKLKKNKQMVISEINAMLVDNIIEDDKPRNRGAAGSARVFGPGPAMGAAMGKFVVPKLP